MIRETQYMEMWQQYLYDVLSLLTKYNDNTVTSLLPYIKR
ncbi:hypothetical protein SAMN05421676_102220 [Salinibacillus kushneri]|uniref:Uncharacterized protein n=1 Tax=Salinibacillus kushneri TaxID=237682 RepID=A0A1I0APR8_9BACI|nr:hypothetical protein SAMN05421676_102220 [Salinibacillus kushneri]